MSNQHGGYITPSTVGTVISSISGNVFIGGSVLTVGGSIGSVSGTVGASIIGTVPVTQSGTNITSIVSTVPSSVLFGASIFGLAPIRITDSSNASVIGVGNVATATADSGNPLKIGGVYAASVITLLDGQRGNLLLNQNQMVVMTLGTGIAGEDDTTDVLKVEQRFSFLNIAAGQATTTVKSGAGFLHSITFNSAATATNTTTVYDNTAASGTVIAIPAATTATVPVTLTYDCSFSTGLTIITATANGSNMTVSYR